MKPIFLIGYMGCGKSTLARAVSRAARLDLIDLDSYIEGRFHKSVPEIFAEGGEKHFRDLETRMLHEVAEFEDVIIACGGGTPCFGDNMEYMNSRGTTVWLDASVDRIHERLVKARRKRPLIANQTDEEIRRTIVDGLTTRLPYYRRATFTLPSDLLEDRAQIAETTSRFLELLSLNP